jgi:hypothetical protein
MYVAGWKCVSNLRAGPGENSGPVYLRKTLRDTRVRSFGGEMGAGVLEIDGKKDFLGFWRRMLRRARTPAGREP